MRAITIIIIIEGATECIPIYYISYSARRSTGSSLSRHYCNNIYYNISNGFNLTCSQHDFITRNNINYHAYIFVKIPLSLLLTRQVISGNYLGIQRHLLYTVYYAKSRADSFVADNINDTTPG